jgi:hypothetical protein
MSDAKRPRSSAGGVHRHAPAPPQADQAALQAFHHGVYFESYAHLAVHEEMLRDEERTLAYKRALEECDIRGKVVLDVGCGTGVLSSAPPAPRRALLGLSHAPAARGGARCAARRGWCGGLLDGTWRAVCGGAGAR